MFPNIFKLYKNVWRSMIQPERVDYSEEALGPVIGNANGRFFRKDSYWVRNLKGQKLSVTLYTPEEDLVAEVNRRTNCGSSRKRKWKNQTHCATRKPSSTKRETWCSKASAPTNPSRTAYHPQTTLERTA